MIAPPSCRADIAVSVVLEFPKSDEDNAYPPAVEDLAARLQRVDGSWKVTEEERD